MILYVTGSRKFYKAVDEMVLKLSLQGDVVMGFCTYNPDAWDKLNSVQKQLLQAAQLHKIDLADEIHVVNLDGYIGQTMEMEIAYAMFKQKKVHFTDTANGMLYLEKFSTQLGRLIHSWMYPNSGGRY